MLSPSFRIDVKLTDEAILNLIKSRAVNGQARITLNEIGEGVGCHWTTAQRVVTRLVNANYIERVGGLGRTGMIYKVLL